MLVVHEIFGVHEHIKDVCRRLAKAGYHAVAPELFARQGDVSKITDIPKVLEIASKVPDAQVLSDLDATVAWAKADKVAFTGFCWGGRIVWLHASQSPKHPSIPVAHVEMMRRELSAPSEIVVYPEAGHAFNADYRPSYVKSAAADGWARMLAFFEKRGV